MTPFRGARFKFRRCPECKQPFVPIRRQAYCSSRCSRAVRNPQVAQGAPRQELRNPPSAVPKVKGSRVGALQARGDQDCETTPTITEIVSRTFGAAVNQARCLFKIVVFNKIVV